MFKKLKPIEYSSIIIRMRSNYLKDLFTFEDDFERVNYEFIPFNKLGHYIFNKKNLEKAN